MTLKKIGFVGLGVMGRSMVSNLMKAGFSLVVNNRTKKSADALVAAGVRGLWNFASVQLAVPTGVIVQNMDLAQSLAVLSHSLETAALPSPPRARAPALGRESRQFPAS